MDYEKKYKEALEMARDIHDGNPSSGTAITVCEQIFPELKRSEDERINEDLLTFLCDLHKLGKNDNFDRFTKSDCAKWITWLEKQKPVEWGEEDEKMLETVIEDITKLAGSCVSYHKDIDWLKSLRPQYNWWPTEEQIKTLEYYMHVLQANEHKEVLFGLMEQLKEL